MLAVVAIKGASAWADQAAHVIWGSTVGSGTPWIIIVDDDVDPFNIAEVLHALVSRCHPYRGIVRLKHTAGSALDPWLSRHEQKYHLGAKAYFNCTWPPDWDLSEIPKKCSFNNIYPPQVQQKALAKWCKHGY